MANKYKAGDQVMVTLDGKAPLYTDENGDLYTKTSGGGRKYVGKKIDLASGKATTGGTVRTDTVTPGEVKTSKDGQAPKGKLEGVITHDDLAVIPPGVKAVVGADGKIVYDDVGTDGKKRQYSIPNLYVDSVTGKTYKSKAEYEKTQTAAVKKKQQEQNQKDIKVLDASKAQLAAKEKAASTKIVAPTGSPRVSKQQLEEWNNTLPSFLNANEARKYSAAAVSSMADSAAALQGITVLVGTVRKGNPSPGAASRAGGFRSNMITRNAKGEVVSANSDDAAYQEPDTDTMAPALAGSLAGSNISEKVLKGTPGYDQEYNDRITYSNGYQDVPVLAGGNEMLFKLKASAVANPTLYAQTVKSLIDAGYLDPKYQSDHVTKAILDAYTQALTEYGDTYQYSTATKDQMKVTFSDFLASTAQYNKDNGILGPEAKQAPVRVDTFTDEAGVRAAARQAFQQATGKIDDDLVNQFVASFHQQEQGYNDAQYQAELAQAGMGGDPNAGTGLAKPTVTGSLDQTLNDNPELKAQKQSMDSGAYLRSLFEVLRGPGL